MIIRKMLREIQLPAVGTAGFGGEKRQNIILFLLIIQRQEQFIL
jgi:hypothetical protein